MKTTNISVLFLLFILVFSACEKDSKDDDDDIPAGVTVEVEDDITSSTTWIRGNTYFIKDRINVTDGAVLTIEPGTIIKFDSEEYLMAGYGSGFGTIIAEGTQENPILFTSAAQIKNPGDWDGIWLYDGAGGSKFKYCEFEFSGGYGNNRATIISTVTFSFDYCEIRNGQSDGILFREDDAGFSSFTNNTFRSIEKSPVQISAQSAHTLGSNNLFDNTNNIFIYSGSITQAGTVKWIKHNVPYQINGDVRLGSNNGTVLEIDPGVSIKFGNGVEFLVAYSSSNSGSLKAEGTASEPITFTSAAPFPSKGDWDGFWFYDGTSNTSFKYCEISYGGGYSSSSGIINIKDNAGANITIENSAINDSQNWGIYKVSGSDDPTLTNVTYSGNVSGDKNF